MNMVLEKEKFSDIQEDTEGAKSFHLLSVGFALISSRPTLLRAASRQFSRVHL